MWDGGGVDFSSGGIVAQRFDAEGDFVTANGELAGVERALLNTTQQFTQSDARVAALTHGGYVVTWRGNGAGDQQGSCLQQIDDAGNKVGTETLINTGQTAGDQQNPDVSAFDTGFVVSWQGPDGGSDGVYTRRYGPSADFSANAATLQIDVDAVNDAPSFDPLTDPATVLEDAGAQTVLGFATGMSPGPANESAQPLTFNVVQTSVTLTFASGPTINASTGDLSYEVSADANGTATFNVTLADDGPTGPVRPVPVDA